MKIFIGSSRESTEAMEWVALCLEDFGHQAVKWDEAGLFPPGEGTLSRLIEISKTVDAAIFIFSEDDKVWYRGDAAHQPRDNVLIEWGLFTGQLGPRRCIICRNGTPRTSTDILGLTFVDISEARRNRARSELRIWASRLKAQPVDPATLHLMAKIEEKERELEAVSRRLAFGNETVQELESILTKSGIVDFTRYELSGDGHWKLLFDFDYFWGASEELARFFLEPGAWRDTLISRGAEAIARRIQWKDFAKDKGHTAFFVRKSLRIFRGIPEPQTYVQFLERLPTPPKESLNQIASGIIIQKVRRERLQEIEENGGSG